MMLFPCSCLAEVCVWAQLKTGCNYRCCSAQVPEKMVPLHLPANERGLPWSAVSLPALELLIQSSREKHSDSDREHAEQHMDRSGCWSQALDGGQGARDLADQGVSHWWPNPCLSSEVCQLLLTRKTMQWPVCSCLSVEGAFWDTFGALHVPPPLWGTVTQPILQ